MNYMVEIHGDLSVYDEALYVKSLAEWISSMGDSFEQCKTHAKLDNGSWYFWQDCKCPTCLADGARLTRPTYAYRECGVDGVVLMNGVNIKECGECGSRFISVERECELLELIARLGNSAKDNSFVYSGSWRTK